MRSTRASSLVAALSAFLAYACTGDPPVVTTGPSNTIDAGLDDAASVLDGGADGAVDPGIARCDPGKPFGAASPIGVAGLMGGGEDYSPRLSADELALYFSTNRSGRATTGLVRATRGTKTDGFSNMADVLPAQGVKGEMNPTVSADGKLLVLSRSTAMPPLTARTMDYVSTATPFTFSAPSILNGAFTGDDGDTFLLPDASALYFSGLVGTFRQILRWKPKPGGPEPFMNDAIVLDGMRHFTAPVVAQNELTMFLGVGVMNNTSLTTVDIHVTTRPTKDLPWAEPIPLGSLNASGVMDAPAWISADGCVITLTTMRDGASRMYIASRPR